MKRAIIILIPLCLLIFSCKPKENKIVTDEEGKVILERFMETMTNADTTIADEILHPDCVFRYPLLPEPVKGIAGYKNLIKNMAGTFSEFHVVIEDVNVKGDKIWCRYSMEGINSGPLGKLPPTGKKFQITGMAITRLSDGKIIEDETYYNVLSFYQQLGFTLVPPNPVN